MFIFNDIKYKYYHSKYLANTFYNYSFIEDLTLKGKTLQYIYIYIYLKLNFININHIHWTIRIIIS